MALMRAALALLTVSLALQCSAGEHVSEIIRGSVEYKHAGSISAIVLLLVKNHELSSWELLSAQTLAATTSINILTSVIAPILRCGSLTALRPRVIEPVARPASSDGLVDNTPTTT